MPASNWTEADVARLELMWLSGQYNARQIADEMGGRHNRHAVLGKAHRLGLSNMDVTAQRAHGKGRKGRAGVSRPKRRPSITKPKREKAMQEGAPEPKNRTILTVGMGECRYAATKEPPHLFCGHPTLAGYSWCAFHFAVCTEPLRVRRPVSAYSHHGFGNSRILEEAA